MLTSDILRTFAGLDTTRQAAILVDHQILDTPTGDAVMAHIAGNAPAQYSALIVALARGAR